MSTLWVIGDSTVSSFEDKYYYPRYGYGTMLDKYLNDNVKVVNIALSGRSSKSYLSEPEYNTLINGMKQGDYLLIGFGHNDEKTEKERYWNITKKEVEVCKDCEFRYNCLDCRAHTKNGLFGKPITCKYNPFIAKKE